MTEPQRTIIEFLADVFGEAPNIEGASHPVCQEFSLSDTVLFVDFQTVKLVIDEDGAYHIIYKAHEA